MNSIGVCLALTTSASVCAAQCDHQILVGSNTLDGDRFGRSVAWDGETIVVGASESGGVGAAYIFERFPDGTFQEVKILNPTVPDPPPSDQEFGQSVALVGDLALVAAPAWELGDGIVYVYERSGGTWVEADVIEYGPTIFNHYFGRSVALDGESLLIGRPDGIGSDPHGVHVYDRSGPIWTEVDVLKPSQYSYLFGHSIAISGDVLLVGAPEPPSAAGSAFVFRKVGGSWQEEQRLGPSDGGYANLNFGRYVALDENRAVVGAKDSAYVFDYDPVSGVWEETLVLNPSDGGEYGTAIPAVSGSRVFVGAAGDDDLGTNTGAVYKYEGVMGALAEVGKVYSPMPSDYDYFGFSFDIVDDVLVAGALGSGVGSGGGNYVIVRPFSVGSSYCTANPNSTGRAASIETVGDCAASGNDLQLRAFDLPPNKFGYFLLSQTQAFFPNPGGSQGNLCIGGTVGRFQAEVQNSGTSGTIIVQADLTNVPLFGQILSGETWNFQCWYRDVEGNSNFTDAVQIPFL